MQFYVLHKNPIENAKILPDYALRKVNLREGWQMLSDIGHAHNLKWDNQNKEYNRYHPNTWRWWKNKECFNLFLLYYLECCLEYQRRFKKTNSFINQFLRFYCTNVDKLCKVIQNMSEEESIIQYILHRKRKFLTKNEIEKLNNCIVKR